MSEMDSSSTFKPPYMAFQTFWNFLGELASKPLPPQIDRSLMSTKSGTDQANLVAALRTFDLIDEDNAVQSGLVPLTDADPDRRKAALVELVTRFYGPALRVSEVNGTEAQLRDVFRETFQIGSNDTLRKAMTFFLHAARTADVELSGHFPATRSGKGAPGVGRTRKPAKRRTKGVPAAAGVEGVPAQVSRTHKTVYLASGGTMTLSVSVDALSLRGEEREFFYEVVDLLDAYADSHPKPHEEPSA